MTKSFDEEEFDAEAAQRRVAEAPDEALSKGVGQARKALEAAMAALERLETTPLAAPDAAEGAAALARLAGDIVAHIAALDALAART